MKSSVGIVLPSCHHSTLIIGSGQLWRVFAAGPDYCRDGKEALGRKDGFRTRPLPAAPDDNPQNASKNPRPEGGGIYALTEERRLSISR